MSSTVSDIEKSAAIVGLIILLHNSPAELPNKKPWNCALCLSVRTAVILEILELQRADQPDFIGALLMVGLTALCASIAVHFIPTAFREFKE